MSFKLKIKRPSAQAGTTGATGAGTEETQKQQSRRSAATAEDKDFAISDDELDGRNDAEISEDDLEDDEEEEGTLGEENANVAEGRPSRVKINRTNLNASSNNNLTTGRPPAPALTERKKSIIKLKKPVPKVNQESQKYHQDGYPLMAGANAILEIIRNRKEQNVKKLPPVKKLIPQEDHDDSEPDLSSMWSDIPKYLNQLKKRKAAGPDITFLNQQDIQDLWSDAIRQRLAKKARNQKRMDRIRKMEEEREKDIQVLKEKAMEKEEKRRQEEQRVKEAEERRRNEEREKVRKELRQVQQTINMDEQQTIMEEDDDDDDDMGGF